MKRTNTRYKQLQIQIPLQKLTQKTSQIRTEIQIYKEEGGYSVIHNQREEQMQIRIMNVLKT